MPLSDYLERALIGYMRGTQMPTPPASLYVAVFTADPTDVSATGTEAAYAGYGRVVVTLAAPAAAPADPGPVLNTNAVAFAPVAGAQITLTAVALMDALTGGNPLAYDVTMADKLIAVGDVPEFAVGALSFDVE